ncbi:MAG TPA: hypothetical protein VE465_22900 [Streptosporangiaceae bacterium]|nr:hypothetical protein [Streptosporangiaceae bacterium]
MASTAVPAVPIEVGNAPHGTKAERRAARALVADYHEARIAELLARVGEAIDRHRGGELDPFEVDQVIHHYHRAARRLWAFCQVSGEQAEVTAQIIARLSERGETIDWWQESAPRRRPARQLRGLRAGKEGGRPTCHPLQAHERAHLRGATSGRKRDPPSALAAGYGGEDGGNGSSNIGSAQKLISSSGASEPTGTS